MYLRFGIGKAAAVCSGGGTLYGYGNFAATVGLSNNMIRLSILFIRLDPIYFCIAKLIRLCPLNFVDNNPYLLGVVFIVE